MRACHVRTSTDSGEVENIKIQDVPKSFPPFTCQPESKLPHQQWPNPNTTLWPNPNTTLSLSLIALYSLSSMAYKVLIWTLISTVCALILKLVSVAIIGGRRKRERAVGFFHPYTNDGGGGERVLWCAVKAVQEDRPDLHCAVFTGDHDASPESLMARALERFGVKLLYPPKVISLALSFLRSYVY